MGSQAESMSEVEHPNVKTILIVEDDSDIGYFLTHCIQEETAFRPLLARDGFQALKIVQEIKPDILLVDYRLPGMNGLQLFDRLHTQIGLAPLPTILITAQGNVQQAELDKRQIILLKKPFELDELVTMLNRLLSPQ